MIQVQEQISLRRQCELLAVGRSGLYWPFYGSRKLCESLRIEGTVVNRKHMQRLMRLMGLESVAPKPDTSKPHPEHPVFPCLLRNLAISQSNQVWATDITYIPMAHGFAYLVAIIDWYSRRVLAWRLSNTLASAPSHRCCRRRRMRAAVLTASTGGKESDSASESSYATRTSIGTVNPVVHVWLRPRALNLRSGKLPKLLLKFRSRAFTPPHSSA